MWAYELTAPGTLQLVDVPTPRETELREGEVLLRVLAGGICGSDVPNFKGALSVVSPPSAARVPGYPMHEVVGEVVASRFPGISPGVRVVGWAVKTDALAEFVVTRGDNVNTYDESLPPTTAVLLQPLACALYTLNQLDIVGQRVAIFGSGPIGVLMTHAAKTMGARHVVGVDQVNRADIAKAFGMDEFVHSATDRWARDLSDEERPEVIVEAIGHKLGPLHDALTAVAFGGTVYYFGVPDEEVYPVPIIAMFRRNLTLKSGRSEQRDRLLAQADDYLREHPELAGQYVTNVFPASEAQRAYEVGSVPAAGRLKVTISME
jgi:L-iditol 2-dehydrogenase